MPRYSKDEGYLNVGEYLQRDHIQKIAAFTLMAGQICGSHRKIALLLHRLTKGTQLQHKSREREIHLDSVRYNPQPPGDQGEAWDNEDRVWNTHHRLPVKQCR